MFVARGSGTAKATLALVHAQLALLLSDSGWHRKKALSPNAALPP